MPSFDVEPERINAFHVAEEYLFSHYFEREDLFERLESYYDRSAYRFAVPVEEFDSLRTALLDEYVELVPIDEIEPYCVVIEQYEPHAEILKQSVANWRRRGHAFFLLPDERWVDEAVERGATPVSESDMALGL